MPIPSRETFDEYLLKFLDSTNTAIWVFAFMAGAFVMGAVIWLVFQKL